MNITFSDHALQRINERNIPKGDIIMAISNCDYREELTRGRQLVRKTIVNNVLEVIFVIEPSQIVVITAYYI